MPATKRKPPRPRFAVAWLAALGLLTQGGTLASLGIAQPFKNGFNLETSSIPTGQILQGGPPRDGIPSINNPLFFTVDETTFLADDDPVIGFSRNGIARAYPLRILVWHELVNDRIGDHAFVVSYCPLCGTALVFDATIDGERRTFGVSGLLFQSDVLMYDHQTESLWSQLALEAVTGAATGTPLPWLQSELLTYGAWKKKRAREQREVLGRVPRTGDPTGPFLRDYSINPYAGYELNQTVWFSVPTFRDEFANKVWVLGLVLDGRAKAYPIRPLKIRGTLRDTFNGKRLEITLDGESDDVSVKDIDTGQLMPFTRSYWFAWQAFYPETELWQPGLALIGGNRIHYSIYAPRDNEYSMEESTDLIDWSSISRFRSTDGIRDLVVPMDPAQPHRFFRVRPDP